MALAPTSGRLASQAGGGSSLKEAKSFAQIAISSTFDTIAPTANVNGTTRTQSSKSVITVTAKARLFPNHLCSEIIKGHVATTTVVAQTIAPKNGRSIQIEDPIRATIKRTASTVRVISRSISATEKTSRVVAWRPDRAMADKTDANVG